MYTVTNLILYLIHQSCQKKIPRFAIKLKLKHIMASTTLRCSSGKSLFSSFASSCRNNVKNGEAEEESQTIAGVREDKVKLKEPSSTTNEIVDYKTYLAQLEDLDKNFNYETYLALFRELNHKEEERLRKKSKAKEEVETHQKEQRLNQTKRPPIRCAKSNKKRRNG